MVWFNRKLLLYILAGFLPVLVNCNAPLEGHKNLPSEPGKGSPPGVTDHAKVCYPGEDGEFNTCLDTTDISNIDGWHDDYLYRDPFEDEFPAGFDPYQYLQPLALVDLTQVGQTTHLSTHFQAQELMQEHKGKFALFSPEAIYQIENLRQEVESPIIVTSGYRSPGYNNRVGGSAKWSRHMYGDALDFYSPDLSLLELKEQCLKFGASFYQVYKTHIHCDWRNLPLNQELFPPPVRHPKFVGVRKLLIDQSSIVVSKSAGEYVLSVNHPDPEDEGELTYDWVIRQGHGKTLFFSTPQVRLPVGDYQVNVKVGDSIELDIQL